MNAILYPPQQQAAVQPSTTQERDQFWGGFVGALILVVIECIPFALWLFRLGTGAPIDFLPNFVQTHIPHERLTLQGKWGSVLEQKRGTSLAPCKPLCE